MKERKAAEEVLEGNVGVCFTKIYMLMPNTEN
jgi:hypothetical protein